MRALRDCEFTAFISYAHADDVAWFGWVTQFRTELERSLGALLRGVRLPRLHLSGDNGPVAGVLGDELKKRIETSFAMIIVVHDNYAHSSWCLQELAYFRSLFGDEGFRQRLYIVALSESAMLEVAHSPEWQHLLPGHEQLWVPFFDPADKSRPLDIYLGPGLVAPAFRQPFERLRVDFALKLRQAVSAPSRPMPIDEEPPEPPETPATPPCSPPSAQQPVGAEVLLGFVNPATVPAANAALAQLHKAGVAARLLAQDVVFSDFADFASARHLVLVLDDAPLMLTTLAAGGQLELQREAWQKKGRAPQDLHWLDLRVQPVGSDSPAATYTTHVAARPLLLPDLITRLQPPRPAGSGSGAVRGVRIYIESNRHERTLWEPLGEQIRLKWDEVCKHLAPDRVPPLSLRTRGLPVDQIDSFPDLDDADGVVLLWGRKTSDALVAQINKVENKMAPGRDAAPGIVAYLMPPQVASEPIPAWGWQVLRFNAEDAARIDVVDEERDELRHFLHKVYTRLQQREQAARR